MEINLLQRKYVLCSACLPVAMLDILKSDGWCIITLPAVQTISSAIAGHIDILCCVISSEEIVVHPELPEGTLKILKTVFKNVIVGRTVLDQVYPSHIAYNGLVIGDLFFHRLEYTDPVLVDRVKNAGLRIISVTQGYTGCSVLPVGNEAIITADSKIAQTASLHGLDVLFIQPGYISLPGFSYGFIGGSAGWDGFGTVYFIGDVHTHPQADKMVGFIKQHGMNIKNLSMVKLFDYGGLIFISISD